MIMLPKGFQFRRYFSKNSLISVGQPYLEYHLRLNEKHVQEISKVICYTDAWSENYELEIFKNLIHKNSSSLNEALSNVSPGGSILRISQFMESLVKNKGKTTYLGACGNDIEGQTLTDVLKLSNLRFIPSYINGMSTAKSLSLILNESSISDDFTVDILEFPGASKDFCLKQESRIAFNSSKIVLTSYMPFETENSTNKTILDISMLATSANKIFVLKLPYCNDKPIDDELSAREWLQLLMNVDVLLLDLNSALKIAKIFANWMVNNKKPQSIRPDIKRRFEEFNESLKLDEDATYLMSLSLAATMPSLAERLAISLAHFPKRNVKKSRSVFLLGCGASTGGVVACTNNGKLKRLSDFSQFISDAKVFDLHTIPIKSQNEMPLIGNGVGRAADVFIAGVLAKMLEEDVNSESFIFESMLFGYKISNFLSKNRHKLLDKKSPINFSSIIDP